MHLRSAAVNALWGVTSTPAWIRFRRALRTPEVTQERVLWSCLKRNADTVFGRAHGFGSIRSVAEYQQRVPPTSYDEMEHLVRRTARGEPHVLTTSPVERLVPSSGSAAAAKFIPATADLRSEFTAAIDAWLVDLFRHRPSLVGGPSYWSVSPLAPDPPLGPDTAIPIGFDSDSRYLGGARQALAGMIFAVPDVVARLTDVNVFRYVSALFLLRARDLRIVSVWHPSFFEGLLDCIAAYRDRLIHDIAHGSLSASPIPLPAGVQRRLASLLMADRPRAAELRHADTHPLDIWPYLSLISCWTDGPARLAAAQLAERCGGIWIQPKGLLATEGVVTIPFEGGHPIAIRSHFFEFVAPDGQVRLAHELQRGVEYAPLLTTGGGLYRYKLGDRVRVDDFVYDTPSLRFVGKDDRVSDLFGEKLNDGFIAGVVEQLFAADAPRFALLAPARTAGGMAYTLFVESEKATQPDLARRLERALRQNPHYAWCVELGQLCPARIVRVGPGAASAFVNACVARGQRLGNVKPASLSSADDWEAILPSLDVEAAC